MTNKDLAKTNPRVAADAPARAARPGYDHAADEPMRRRLRWLIDNIG